MANVTSDAPPLAADRPDDGPPPRRGLLARRGVTSRVPPVIWVLLLVPLAVELFWVFWPAFNSFQLSFTKWNGVGAAQPVGLKNYRTLFADPVFHTAIKNTVIWAIGFGGLSVLIGLALAVALNRPRRGVGIYRSAIYLPMVFSLAVTGLFWRVLYQPDGPINTVLAAIGVDTGEHQWLADPRTALAAILVAAIWRQAGYIMVLYLAGLKGCDPSLEEAAAVDGATAWQRFRFVVMPQLKNVNTVVFAVTVIDSLRTFDIVWAMTRGGPYDSTQLLSTYMYQVGFSLVNLGYGSAIAVVIFVLAIAFIITYLVRATREED
ncbi:carbohydrate ABC transporter permease [Microlunatus flavus]|uniref:Multiple sugar transport system permease protein n=1 Tax=Microlunatus flavus TaxID=1036181 RepID=A0A1H9IDP5_9ACTN|nr:sugar ABC transporter permease [Microlunatus flavus]SEQ72505.1 multiple sugar transport system permease protein [Microlunatus flavus]